MEKELNVCFMMLKDIIKLNNGLHILSDKKLPIKLSYIIARNIYLTDNIAEATNKIRDNLLQQYGEKDKETGELIVNNNGQVKIVNLQAFASEIKKLMDNEEQINLLKINFSEIVFSEMVVVFSF